MGYVEEPFPRTGQEMQVVIRDAAKAALAVDGRPMGRVTTGLFSPSTGRCFGMGYVEDAFSRVGQEIQVVIRDSAKAAVVARRPFYKSPHWR